MSTEAPVLERTEEAVGETKKKVSKSETGDAKNVANFTELIIAVKTFGEKYNPSAEVLTIAGLEALRDKADQSIVEMQKADTDYRDAVNKRQTAFEGLSSLTTQVKNSAEAAGVDPKVQEELASIGKKITGDTVKKEKDKTGGKSVSQMSVDNRTNNFRQLVTRLSTVPEYSPNESELTLVSLNAYVGALRTLTTDLKDSEKALEKARKERDNLMSESKDSLVPVAFRVKKYVSSVFKVKSSEYKSIKGIRFKNVKRK